MNALEDDLIALNHHSDRHEARQVAETAAKHFAGVDGLWLLALESEDLDALRWEVSRGGAEFPHLYRPLRADDVLWARPLPLTAQGHNFTGLLE